MSTNRIAINGFGRIGRLALRHALAREDLEVVGINDLADREALAYLFKHDSVHGRYPEEVRAEGDRLVVGERRIPFTNVPDPRECGWGDADVDVVLEATGAFDDREKAAKHLEGGARRVLISAPAKKPDLTVCLGVNHEDFDPEQHHVVSNASCTTNCVAPPLKALHDAFGLRWGVLDTVHAYTISQGLQDEPQKKVRRGRAAALNLVPTSTGAAKAVGEVIPGLQGRLDGMAVRSPNADGSLADLTLTFDRDVSVDDVHGALRDYAQRHPEVLEVSDEELVSSDIVGNLRSSVVDTQMTMKVGELVKLLCWYDNESAYARRLVDVGLLMAEKSR